MTEPCHFPIGVTAMPCPMHQSKTSAVIPVDRKFRRTHRFTTNIEPGLNHLRHRQV